ncbi:MAG: hypothetical protein DDT40_01635 [candidate division WS2 bacterium]|nr:hypothetical protein [Candidatus Psychracetigena formicireducens]
MEFVPKKAMQEQHIQWSQKGKSILFNTILVPFLNGTLPNYFFIYLEMIYSLITYIDRDQFVLDVKYVQWHQIGMSASLITLILMNLSLCLTFSIPQ